MLYFMACRVLGSPEEVEDAVQSCYLAASRNPPKFENQGAFTSWLLRILIDEALVILQEKKERIDNPPRRRRKVKRFVTFT